VPSAEQPRDQVSLKAAYATCERLARQHYENFPVGSRLLPRKMRPHVAAVYAFARVADDFADEGERPAGERQRLLDDWLERLRAAAGPTVGADLGRPPLGGTSAGGASAGGASAGGASSAPTDVTCADEQHHLLFVALGNTIRQCRLPVGLFEDLLSAFRQDTTKTRYETFEQLLHYCRRSANPVGRLVLRIAGYEDTRVDVASDFVCTALQLVNFWQDLGRDWERGRLYVPLDEIRDLASTKEHLLRPLG